MIRIPAGEIGLILANAGAPISSERILGKTCPAIISRTRGRSC